MINILGWLEAILISKCIYYNFDSMDALRLQPDYVNSLILSLFHTVLHNLQSEYIDGDDVITAFRQWTKIEGFLRKSK